MSSTRMEANIPAQELGKLGALLSDLEATLGKNRNSSEALSIDGLKKLLFSIRESISDLENRISDNRGEQSHLAAESAKLKKEIRELSEKLEEEVTELMKVTERL